MRRSLTWSPLTAGRTHSGFFTVIVSGSVLRGQDSVRDALNVVVQRFQLVDTPAVKETDKVHNEMQSTTVYSSCSGKSTGVNNKI